jgi:DNA polymerase V
MGFRTHDEDGALDTMSLDEYLIENKEATFMLLAKSDSMREAGILRGDLVIVDRSKSPQSGDIVIAVIDGGFVMRYLEDLPVRDLKVEAVVTGVVRKY